jgi:cytochrome c oxidase subunit II
VTVLLSAVAGCDGPFPQSTFAPKSDLSLAVDQLFTSIFWWAVVVFVIVEGLLLYAVIRYRHREGAGQPKALHGHTALEIGWTLAPALILVFIAVPTMRTIFATARPAPEGAVRVEVIGHQWWWEYRYPAVGIVTANELHLPVGTPVQLEMTSADVIHSFWAPALGGKRDLTAGRTTRIAFRADSAGEYMGQCAEFCGASHANMRLRVFVEPDSAFQAWVAAQRQIPAAVPRGSDAERGRELFGRSACIACHTIEGVPTARGIVGPNLTHVASRTTLAGGLFPNTADNLRRWIADAPAMKPGALMTPQPMADADLTAIVAYLQSLR